jgi:hypothetical protein
MNDTNDTNNTHNPHKPNTPMWYAYEAGRAQILDIKVASQKVEIAHLHQQCYEWAEKVVRLKDEVKRLKELKSR